MLNLQLKIPQGTITGEVPPEPLFRAPCRVAGCVLRWTPGDGAVRGLGPGGGAAGCGVGVVVCDVDWVGVSWVWRVR